MGRWLSSLALAIVIAVALASPSAGAEDWPQWRGPLRDGVVPAASAPVVWPESLRAAWRVEVGEGYSSPIVAADRVFLHSRRDPAELVTALDLADGAVLWQRRYPASFEKNSYAVEMAKGPNATPLVAEGRVVTLGVTGILSAWRAEDGELLWRRDFTQLVDTSKLFCGTAASPLLEGGSLIVQVGSDVAGGRVLALDPSSGEERWTWSGAGPGYASPIAIDVDGVRQIVALTEGSLVGLDAKTGQELWSMPFTDEWHENIATPIWTGQHLVVSGPRQGTHAFAIARWGDGWTVSPSWSRREVSFYMSTPVLDPGAALGGVLFGLSSQRKGQIVALAAATGKVLWSTEGREGEQASIALLPEDVLILTNDGVLRLVARTVDGFRLRRRYEVAQSATWAAPVVLEDGLLVRDTESVTRLVAGTGAGASD